MKIFVTYQDHLVHYHFKDRIASDLPTKKPYICPMAGCENKHYPDWQVQTRARNESS